MAVSNTITYVTDFDLVLQRRLNRPMTWKEVCDVTYSNANIIRSSYISTMPSVQTVDRGVGVALQTFAQTSNTITIETGRDLGVLVDLADDAQSPWTKKAELFERIGSLLNEFIESHFLADHASWTDFTNASIGGAAGNITVSASNIDDIIRGVKREIRENNAQELADQNGVCFDWRAADFEYLESFIQANGFTEADKALKNGTKPGLRYMGCDHYYTNDNTSGHVFAGVKGVMRLGILKATYGKAHVINFPAADSNTFFSGMAYYSRVDAGRLTPGGLSTAVFDITVA